MSTDFTLSKKVTARDLFGGQLEKFGVREHVRSDTSERSRSLTDGRSYLTVYVADDGFVGCLTRYGANAPGKILNAIAEVFETEIFSEYQPQFFGFATQEEWDAAMKKLHDQHQREFYADICAYVRGEPNNIRRGTIGEIQARIAKQLIAEHATMIGEKDKLLAAIEAIYHRDHAAVVTIGPEDKAWAEMLITHEDDLPQA
ncbi:hypothetical protein [Bradyrhizobium sp. SZCCHNS1054]|uniref:hypothetical protein n=1 Tax=Bradyrhizobium sp. SZCCHNS1054 TaxID=3057301 RepID=UPI0029163CEF|nr:hypothetical protein [Bradyrhizobium sp. SZCCHNS1054]